MVFHLIFKEKENSQNNIALLSRLSVSQNKESGENVKSYLQSIKCGRMTSPFTNNQF